ncbi:hypothetical protein B0H12DRAFT_1142704 [Mycena haematopus]|nr:hypothetical protein B0H12DRAFT_1142704 [Mycena haematopus]
MAQAEIELSGLSNSTSLEDSPPIPHPVPASQDKGIHRVLLGYLLDEEKAYPRQDRILCLGRLPKPAIRKADASEMMLPNVRNFSVTSVNELGRSTSGKRFLVQHQGLVRSIEVLDRSVQKPTLNPAAKSEFKIAPSKVGKYTRGALEYRTLPQSSRPSSCSS